MSDEPRAPSHEADETRTLHAAPGEAAAADLGGMPAEVDGYRLLGVLGQGGMGVVYLAEQKEPRRRVALKVIRGSAHTDSLHVRLFRREAETLGRLRHPNIGAIYGAGRLPDGRPYFAMELVEGPTLDAYLARVGRHAEAEKYLLLAEEALRQPRESGLRRRLAVLDALVDLERAWGARTPSAARTAALERWTAARDAEAPELRSAIAEGRVPRAARAS